MFFLSLSVRSENWVPFYCKNNRDNSQFKLVIQENNHQINLSQLQVRSLASQSTKLQEKTKEHFVLLIHSKKFTFFCCNQYFMACLSILNYTLPFSCFNWSYDWNLRNEKCTVFTSLGEKIKNEATNSLFFVGKVNMVVLHVLFFSSFFFLPFLSFSQEKSITLPRLCKLASFGPLAQMTRYYVAKFSLIYFTTKLMS